MKDIKVVIGSNYGDEGKGLITSILSEQAAEKGSVLNILHNGGCQRGHTADGHVYHCYGSGTKHGVVTYYHKDFLFDPIGIYLETEQLIDEGYFPSPIRVDGRCRVVTPFDKLYNQKREEARGDRRHGSCGMGIYATIMRNEDYVSLTVGDLLDDFLLYEKLRKIRYAYKHDLNCDMSDVDIDEFMRVVNLSKKYWQIKDYFDVLNEFDTIIYEGGQGLLLDKDNMDDFPHLTPSYTGSKAIAKEINLFNAKPDIYYVSRSYLTRHGAGPLPNECDKEDIGFVVDNTNIPNNWQGSLRFAHLNLKELLNRTKKDFSYYTNNATYHLVFTCLNQTCGCIPAIDADTIIPYKNVTYIGNENDRKALL